MYYGMGVNKCARTILTGGKSMYEPQKREGTTREIADIVGLQSITMEFIAYVATLV